MRADNPITATLGGLLDRSRRRPALAPLRDAERLDGRTALVTGAGSGLGRAVAVALARRGASLILPSRRQPVETLAALEAVAPGVEVWVPRADLSDLGAIRSYCAELAERRARVDVAVFNAGVMPRRARRTAQGFEELFAVNFLAKVAQLRWLLASGVIPNRALVDKASWQPAAARPRIIVVASESHRSARTVELDRLGDYTEYNMRSGMAEYAYSKLLLLTYCAELTRRLNPGETPEVAVHALCPGAVDTRIAREAPIWVRPLLKPVMRLFFQSPERAAQPIEYLACAEGIEERTGLYLHLTTETPPRNDTLDLELGRRLWDAAQALVEHRTPP